MEATDTSSQTKIVESGVVHYRCVVCGNTIGPKFASPVLADQWGKNWLLSARKYNRIEIIKIVPLYGIVKSVQFATVGMFDNE